MIKPTLEDLCSFLLEAGFAPSLQEETGQVAFMMKHKDIEFPVFVRLYGGKDLLQLLVFLPLTYAAKTEADVARLLHFLNKQLDIPGFGMDEEASYIFFRHMLPVQEAIHPEELQRGLKLLEHVTLSFTPVIMAVAQGGTSFTAIAKQVKGTLEGKKKH